MEFIPYYCKCRVLILGCGNVLFGDDGFGPAVVKYLQENYKLPEEVVVIDAGTSIREFLFIISLSEIKPQKIIVIDAVDIKEVPGKILEIDISNSSQVMVNDFSMHQFPTSGLLKELKEVCKIEVKVIAAQVENIPREINPGISKTLERVIPQIGNIIVEEINA